MARSILYCEQSDIEADFKDIDFEATESAVTEDELAELIEQESNYIDGRIGVKYTTPVDPADYEDAYSILKRICVFRVSERIRNVIEIKTGISQKDADEKKSGNKVRTPDDDLTLIIKGLLLLKDVPLLNQKSGFESFNVDCDVEHVFKTTKQQW